MRNLLALVGFIVVTLGVGGWVMDWYNFRSFAQEEGRYLVAFEVNHQKMGEDFHRVQAWVNRTLSNAAQDKGPTSPTNANQPAPTANPSTVPAPGGTPQPNAGAGERGVLSFTANSAAPR